MRASRWLATGIAGVAVVGGIAAWAAWGVVSRQGDVDWEADGSVELDEWGVPTLTASDWPALVEAQGYVTASERMWQMDLTRRLAEGRLAEWFGQVAVDRDRSRRVEDWSGVAERAALELPTEEHHYCTRYAAGVNRFIDENPGAWGLEYVLLGTAPEPWTCADSMLVLFVMAERLSSTAWRDEQKAAWVDALDEEWVRFLFPQDHPWNEPLFGESPGELALPTTTLPSTPLAEALGRSVAGAGPMEGSNSWAWRGRSARLLANDPHLGNTVPQIWYAVRMRVSEDDWVVGMSIAGLPGVVLGMNPHLAWAYTNTGEDVDDLLVERVEGNRYLHAVSASGQEEWRDLRLVEHTIEVKDGGPVRAVARITARGPLVECLDGQLCSHQWLPWLHPSPGLPTVQIDRSRDWAGFNEAVDRMTMPAQNILVMERDGDFGYRVSGTGVVRSVDGDIPRPALEGAWEALEAPSSRWRLFVPADEGSPAWLATANARIWVDDVSHRWASDRRTARIHELLEGQDQLTREDMEAFQLDTRSRYHEVLLAWVAEHAPGGDAEVLERWRGWTGHADRDPLTFTEALAVERSLVDLMLGQVRRHRLGYDAPYPGPMADAFVLRTLGTDDGLSTFGLDEAEVATHLVEVAREAGAAYAEGNAWTAQHPFVGRVPVVDRLFRVEEYPQPGYDDLVRVETPAHGASFRAVWDLSDPSASTWSFPVGQSGHAHSAHYADQQDPWRRGERIPVFPDPSAFGL